MGSEPRVMLQEENCSDYNKCFGNCVGTDFFLFFFF